MGKGGNYLEALYGNVKILTRQRRDLEPARSWGRLRSMEQCVVLISEGRRSSS